MLARLSWFAPLCLLLPPACGDVEQCQLGTPGCYGGAPVEGRCKAGLVPSNGSCSEPGRASAPLSCDCAEGTVCTLDEQRCVDYCAPLEVELGGAGASASVDCDATTLDFAALCRNACLLDCQQQRDFCDGACDPASCDAPEVLGACQDRCGDALDPALCMARQCGDVRARGCAEVQCASGAAPRCEGVICRNACPGYNFDGVCDDGDLSSASSGACNWGSDCADCAPRRGSAPEPARQGEPCAFHSACLGSSPADLSQADSWCIKVDPARGISRCAPDCSDPRESCPVGSACFELSLSEQPLMQDRLTASACFPVQCGG